MAEKLNNYFENAVKSLDISEDRVLLTPAIGIYDPIDITIKNYEKHPSILAIKGKVVLPQQKFTFIQTELADMEKEVKSLNGKKATTFKNIPAKQLKYTFHLCGLTLNSIWCDAVIHCTFPNKLKLADSTPTFKTDNKTCANNYRPLSILPVVSKIFERIMQRQINSYVEKYLSPFLCGYRKGYSTRIALTAMVEKWVFWCCFDGPLQGF